MNRSINQPANRVFGSLYNDLDNVLSAFFADTPASRGTGVKVVGNFPAINVWEDSDGYHLEAELPGLSLDDLELTVAENELSIKGERKSAKADGVTVHRRERGVGTFHRVVCFPVDLDADKVQARLTNGVLHLDMPKAEKAKARKIDIKTMS